MTQHRNRLAVLSMIPEERSSWASFMIVQQGNPLSNALISQLATINCTLTQLKDADM